MEAVREVLAASRRAVHLRLWAYVSSYSWYSACLADWAARWLWPGGGRRVLLVLLAMGLLILQVWDVRPVFFVRERSVLGSSLPVSREGRDLSIHCVKGRDILARQRNVIFRGFQRPLWRGAFIASDLVFAVVLGDHARSAVWERLQQYYSNQLLTDNRTPQGPLCYNKINEAQKEKPAAFNISAFALGVSQRDSPAVARHRLRSPLSGQAGLELPSTCGTNL